MSRDIIIFRLTYGYKLVAVMPCEKLVYGDKNQLSTASETVPYISVEDIKTLTFMVVLSRGVFKQNNSKKTLLRLIHIHIVLLFLYVSVAVLQFL